MSNYLKKNWLKVLTFCLISIGFFLFFFLRNHYYLSAQLDIGGDFKEETKVILSWDAGRGFNQFEQIPIVFEAGTSEKVVDLPQLPIKNLKITNQDSGQLIEINSLKIESANGERDLNFSRNSDQTLSSSLNPQILEKIHPLLLGLQIIFSLMMTWLFFEFVGLKKRLKQPDWCLTLKYIFFKEKHWFFWLLFIVAIGVFMFWLLGQWPGAGSTDSFYQWYQTKSLHIEDSHPYLSTIYLIFLEQFYDSFASVAIFQILATAALSSFIFYYVFKKGVNFYLILPFYLFFIFSVPVGLFNIIVWKDVPFSILLIFWAFYLFYLGFQKKEDQEINPGFKKIVVLSFSLILLIFFRHNGIINLFFIPFLIWLGGLMPKRVLVKFLMVTIFLFFIFKWLVPYALNIPAWSSKSVSLAWKMNTIAALITNKNYYSDNLDEDKKLFDRAFSLDKLSQYYNPSHGGTLADQYNLDLIKDEDVAKVNHLFYLRVFQNLPIYFSERIYLFTTLITGRLLTWTNEFHSNYYQAYIYNWGSGTDAYLQFAPVSKTLYHYQLIMVQIMNLVKIALLNLIFPTLFLLIVVFCYKWFPLSARSSFLILLPAPIWFFIVIAPDWRYLYSIYLFSFFIFPLIFLEIKTLRQNLLTQKRPNYPELKFLRNRKIFAMLHGLLYLIFLLPYFVSGCIIYYYIYILHQFL